MTNMGVGGTPFHAFRGTLPPGCMHFLTARTNHLPGSLFATGLGTVKAKPPRGAQCAALTAPPPRWRRGCHREESPSLHVGDVPVGADGNGDRHHVHHDSQRWEQQPPALLPSKIPYTDTSLP